MMRRYLSGPQDMTITDGATDTVRRIWVGLGGQPLAHASIGWTKIFRPAATSGAILARRTGRDGLRRSMRFVAPPFDAAARTLMRRRSGFVPAEPEGSKESLTVEALLNHMRDAAERWPRLHIDYDAEYLGWLFRELAAVDVRGELVRHLVRDRDSRIAGWYVYYLAPGSVAQVLQVAAPSGDPGLVLDHLFWHAASGGAAAVQGRVEAELLGPLRARRCLLSGTEWALVHCEDQKVLGLLGSAQAMLTRLDGEWWMGHHVLWRESVATAEPAQRPDARTPEHSDGRRATGESRRQRDGA